jgi:hypothetical protein
VGRAKPERSSMLSTPRCARWRTSSLCTRSSNERGRRLHEGHRLRPDRRRKPTRQWGSDHALRARTRRRYAGDPRATALPSRRTRPETADCPGDGERRISHSYRRSRASLVRESRLHTREVGGSKPPVPTHESPADRLLSVSSRALGRLRASAMSSGASLVRIWAALGLQVARSRI